MTLRSMTGRGTGHAASRLARVEVELSSVNRRQLDVAVGLPRVLASYESAVQDEIRRAVARGRVTGEIRVTWSPRAQAGALRVDARLARAQVRALRAAAAPLGLPDNLQAADLLILPEVVSFVRAPEDIEALWPAVGRALRAALARLNAMRRREGASLGRDVRARLRTLASILKRIERTAPAAAAAARERLLGRIGPLLPGAGLADDPRVLKEIALAADRADITEETVRLRSHLGQAGDLLRAGGLAGRTLDFLAQEMGREINTLGAKAASSGLAALAIDFKTELERVREQAQNIE